MVHVGVVVDDLAAAIVFFTELGLELEGEAQVGGHWVDRVVGLDGVQVDIAMMRTPDGHGRLELTKFRRPKVTTTEGKEAANTLGIRRIMFAVKASRTSLLACTPMAPNSLVSWPSTRTAIGSVTSAALRGSSSRWPSRSDETFDLLLIRFATSATCPLIPQAQQRVRDTLALPLSVARPGAQ